ncbi:hypothetical protein AB205_0212430 [Aquarana catesbeiana]|uniref:Uncharacterized protein n=1 Tax=Aquarana catesbeiana TaxID=8400 RepID=A0A2G9R466_AQUCT|nr:hypothetical protein AB205_0212430 [Aquarana catesbeiana]
MVGISDNKCSICENRAIGNVRCCIHLDYVDKPSEKTLKLVLKVGGSEVTELSGSGHDSSYYEDRSDYEQRERHKEKKKKKKKKAEKEKEKHVDEEERRRRKVCHL